MIDSKLASHVAEGKKAQAAGRPIPPKKLWGSYAALNVAALGAVLVAGAYIGSEHMPAMPDWNKYWNRLRKGGAGEEGPA
ncbi:hypothetical protein CcaverHIS002_0401530 [Cutaneotrichosporon cavernicola]|uniref:Uncharacterized protein n=1 Tax=Cutaneotrichosporon cavernicola TaxID=279322 RepID=A0AA48L3L9_9TREE|nr:uncharacterized protein CcaverHIS019_0401500 [Cutaneotrichosporon cavernicola]BEI83549.1 hypothetical protein CcaverHIS002_0401530 [Cutaneotrichosporon cavernicola]BEI91330.1 hypothetical protein CcaverHIS019_0401500 [Cutaneotrichosporon cavernicola]BEI99103.1 hypothetical protein CcaverHIS631_0401460 [Cutaneotrichosporon cavernicola]BEJ06877.1 hypothetical protein CcaverHIS641_0401460 [Cutaneotrichosporon cavernicola]